MSGAGATALLVGTRAGLYRWQAGAVSPLDAGGEPVTLLASLPGGGSGAGTAAGELLQLGPDGALQRRVATGVREAVTALLHLAGPAPALLVGTERGRLLGSRGPGRSFEAIPVPVAAEAPLRLFAVPGRPGSALLLLAGQGVWRAADRWGSFEPWLDGGSPKPHELAVHPVEGELWLAAADDRVLRSTDGARSFRAAAGTGAGLRPRALHFSAAPPHHAFVVTWPRREPPDPVDPSPLCTSRDGGQTFHAIPSHRIDRARDPSGEISAITSWRERGAEVIALGTDRGELLEWRGGERRATLLADGLPPIGALLALPAPSAHDPSTSGVLLLP